MSLRSLNLRQVAEKLAEVEPKLEHIPPQTTVKRHVDGDLRPSPDYMNRYLVVTERAVGPNDWHELSMQRLAEKQAPPQNQPQPTAASA